MGTRTAPIRIFEDIEGKEAIGEKQAILFTLRQLGIEGLECKFDTQQKRQGKLLQAIVSWEAENDIADLQIGRRVDKVLARFQK